MVSFTGSTATGRAVMTDAAATLKKVFLELGGKSAFVVLDDADLHGACSVSAFTASMHAGQGCAITTRLVVPRAKYDEAVAVAAATMGSIKAGDPDRRPAPSAGQSFPRGSATGSQSYLDLAIAEGGTFACGGGRPADRDTGFFIEPTVIAGLTNEARPAREEIFGPVLTVIAHDGDEDALRIANDSPYGLSGTRLQRRPASALRASPLACASAPSTSTAASGTRPTRRSAVTSSPASDARWVSPVSRSTWKSKPLRQRSSREPERKIVRFENKVAIVTGAGGGIGQAYAEALAARGRGRRRRRHQRRGGARSGQADHRRRRQRAGDARSTCRTRVSAKEMADRTLAEFGGIDYLVNNAAIFGGMKLDFLLTVDPEYYKKFMSVNLDGALWCTRAVYRKMAKRGGGAIVNQSSTAAWLYSNFYGLAKVGINGLTQQLAHELGGQNIRINAIAPGPIDTEANRTTTPQEIVQDIVKGLPLSRMGTPEDLVGMCLFLLSDEASWITGQIFNVDGGQVIRS